MAEKPVLIAGAGIGGLTLALSLKRRGITPLLIERAPRLEEIGAGLQISPNASRVLDALGLGAALDDAGVQPESICLIDGRGGTPIAEIPLGPAAEARWGAPYRLIHRAALQKILAEAVAKAGVEIKLGAELSDFSENPDGVTARVNTRAGQETLLARALIGADGVRSIVRTRLGGGMPKFSGQIAWRATATMPGQTQTRVFLGPGAHLVTYPIDSRGTVNLVAVTRGRPSEGWAQPGDAKALMRAFRGWATQVRDILEAADIWMTWALYDSRSVRGGRGRVTLIGDAAHPVLPHLAQGAALAIEDAAVLAAHLPAQGDAAHAFRSYETTRAARAGDVQAAARKNGEIFRMSGPAAFARNAALRLLGPERLMARFDWVYGYRAK